MILIDESGKEEYDARVDTWAIGVLLYILVSGKVPFDGWDDEEETESDERLFSNIVNSRVCDTLDNMFHIPHKLFLFLARCLEKDPKDRAFPLELYFHPWIVNNTDPNPELLFRR